MAKRGAKTKLTPELLDKICELLAAGNYIATVCAVVGIATETYYDWRLKNSEFSCAVEKARAGSETDTLARIRKAGQEGIWQADAWFLERSYPDRWGRTRQEITGKDGNDLTIKIVYADADSNSNS